MKINYNLKQLGKKHPIISKQTLEIEIPGSLIPLEELIKAIVKQQVAVYNAKETEISLVKYLLPNQIEDQSLSGKVGFSSIYNENKAVLDKSVETALQAFEDGIYCVFVDDIQIEKLSDTINILPESVFSFIRLSFLAGSIW